MPTVNGTPKPLESSGVANDFELRSPVVKLNATISARPSPFTSATRKLSDGNDCRRFGIVHAVSLDAAKDATVSAEGVVTLRRTPMLIGARGQA